ncbi:hypothetical protein HNR46_001808 [Haloferula luteola]|uniref:DUF4114 domain-containing protein n=1 Tax=Haloferula luteola TaxID=595692 RepID=A0A840VFJ5_9BACT|nr:DUF4114 domain-containing protein [Haloferula luteola]MBB5351571.1 hypothetical protein [Haloferula luteola]
MKTSPLISHSPASYSRGLFLRAIALGLGTVSLTAAQAQTEASFQDAARPFGLEVAGPVMAAGSDEASASFQTTDLPVLLNFVNQNLSEATALQDISAVSLDPAALTLGQDSSVRVYFLSEGAGYLNTLGYTTESVANGTTSDPLLIFPDASSDNVYYSDPTSSDITRNDSVPITPGDFVDLGTIAAGNFLDFFLIANGAYGGSDVYTADAASNPDSLQHLVAFALEGSPYLLIGFEDLYGGGDLDFNDLVIAIDIGAANVARLANPEPSFWIMMAALVGIGFWQLRRQPKAVPVPVRITDS